MKNRPIATLILLLIPAAAYYYFCVDTLSLSEILGRQNSARATIVINLFDFDTGLTRCDLHRLSKKSDYWRMRMARVNAIRDPARRNLENEKLLAEMMEDPALKKIIRTLLSFGTKTSMSILETFFKVSSI